MNAERGMAAIRLEGPDEIPHTQYITHPEWLQHLRAKHGKPDAGFAELLDFDFRWSTDLPEIPRGRWTDMGHAVWQPDGNGGVSGAVIPSESRRKSGRVEESRRSFVLCPTQSITTTARPLGCARGDSTIACRRNGNSQREP